MRGRGETAGEDEGRRRRRDTGGKATHNQDAKRSIIGRAAAIINPGAGPIFSDFPDSVYGRRCCYVLSGSDAR